MWIKPKSTARIPSWTRGRFKMTIKPGDNNLGEIKLDPTQFNKVDRRPAAGSWQVLLAPVTPRGMMRS